MHNKGCPATMKACHSCPSSHPFFCYNKEDSLILRHHFQLWTHTIKTPLFSVTLEFKGENTHIKSKRSELRWEKKEKKKTRAKKKEKHKTYNLLSQLPSEGHRILFPTSFHSARPTTQPFYVATYRRPVLASPRASTSPPPRPADHPPEIKSSWTDLASLSSSLAQWPNHHHGP